MPAGAFQLIQCTSSHKLFDLNANRDLDNLFVPFELIIDEAQGLGEVKAHRDSSSQMRFQCCPS